MMERGGFRGGFFKGVLLKEGVSVWVRSDKVGKILGFFVEQIRR